MIDTSKYKGHAKAPWRIVWRRDTSPLRVDVTVADVLAADDTMIARIAARAEEDESTRLLLIAAPLLLAEKERLQAEAAVLKAAAREYLMNSTPFPFDDSQGTRDRLAALCGEVDNG
jgi:hypothetical protein